MKVFLDQHKPFEQHFGVKFEEPKIMIHANGFMSVTIDWTCKQKNREEFWRFKYPELTCRTFGGVTTYKRKKYLVHSASFEFPDLDADFEKLEMASWFDLIIGSETQEEYDGDSYEFVFFEKTKYGLVAWFGRKNWENWSSAVEFKN